MEPTQKGTSQIHDDWSKIQTAISSLSNKTLDDCVTRLNKSLFNKLYKSTKDDISIETFDKIMTEIDDDVKTHVQCVDTKSENKKNDNSRYVDKEKRQFIIEPVIFVPFLSIFFVFLTFVVVVDCVVVFCLLCINW